MDPLVLVGLNERVATVTIINPKARSALLRELLVELLPSVPCRNVRADMRSKAVQAEVRPTNGYGADPPEAAS